MDPIRSPRQRRVKGYKLTDEKRDCRQCSRFSPSRVCSNYAGER